MTFPSAVAARSCRYAAAQLEARHEWAVLNYVASLQERRPAVGACALPVAGGHAFHAGPSPFSFAVGIGIERPVAAGELDVVEAFYAEHHVPCKIDITPATDASLARMLEQRGYHMADLTSVLALQIDDAEFGTYKDDVDLRWAHDSDCKAWVDVIARTLFVSEPGVQRRKNIACMFHAPTALNVMASVNRQLAGVAGTMIPHDGGMAVIYGSCTLPEFRRLGVHHEMLRLRVDTARVAGCDSVLATALPGSDSQRNLERCGFELCYVKTTWTKDSS